MHGVISLLIRFLIGGAMVCAFSLLGDIFRPKSFAGLFGAAPSVALATLLLSIATSGKAYAALEGRSMMAGALAFFVYATAVGFIMMRHKTSALWTTVALIPAWLGCALGLWMWWGR